LRPNRQGDVESMLATCCLHHEWISCTWVPSLDLTSSIAPVGAKDGFFCTLVDVVVDNFGGQYPELRTNRDRVCCCPLPQSAYFSTPGSPHHALPLPKLQVVGALSGSNTSCCRDCSPCVSMHLHVCLSYAVERRLSVICARLPDLLGHSRGRSKLQPHLAKGDQAFQDYCRRLEQRCASLLDHNSRILRMGSRREERMIKFAPLLLCRIETVSHLRC
jgi:hypothetical protein